jgi:hypothetical protein
MGRWPEKPIDKPTKFEVVYKDDDGTESTWKYDLKKFPNGPIEVINKFPAGYDKMMKKQQKEAKLEKKKSILEKAADAKKDAKKGDKKYW